MQYLVGLVRHLLQVVADAGGSDDMAKAVAAVRAVDLKKFKVMSWQQVAFDMGRHGDTIDTGRLPDILKRMLQPPPSPAPPPAAAAEAMEDVRASCFANA